MGIEEVALNTFLKLQFSRFQCSMTWPPSYPPTHSVINYKSNSLDSNQSLLQKVQISSVGPKDTNQWVLTISEYKIEVDYFHLIAPDDEQKCMRKFVLTSNGVALTLENSTGGFCEKKEFLQRQSSSDLDVVFKYLPDMKINEKKALGVFYNWHRECWMINDGILTGELSRVEQENKRQVMAMAVSNRRKQHHQEESLHVVHHEIPQQQAAAKHGDRRDETDLLENSEKDTVVEVENCEDSGVFAMEEADSCLITEDELWENRDFLE